MSLFYTCLMVVCFAGTALGQKSSLCSTENKLISSTCQATKISSVNDFCYIEISFKNVGEINVIKNSQDTEAVFAVKGTETQGLGLSLPKEQTLYETTLMDDWQQISWSLTRRGGHADYISLSLNGIRVRILYPYSYQYLRFAFKGSVLLSENKCVLLNVFEDNIPPTHFNDTITPIHTSTEANAVTSFGDFNKNFNQTFRDTSNNATSFNETTTESEVNSTDGIKIEGNDDSMGARAAGRAGGDTNGSASLASDLSTLCSVVAAFLIKHFNMQVRCPQKNEK